MPPLLTGATGEPVTHRNWTDEWVTVRCAACGREDEWPHPELGCGCGAVLRVPVRPPDGGPTAGGGTDPGSVTAFGTASGTAAGDRAGHGAGADLNAWPRGRDLDRTTDAAALDGWPETDRGTGQRTGDGAGHSTGDGTGPRTHDETDDETGEGTGFGTGAEARGDAGPAPGGWFTPRSTTGETGDAGGTGDVHGTGGVRGTGGVGGAGHTVRGRAGGEDAGLAGGSHPPAGPSENRAHATPGANGHHSFAERYPAHIPLPPTAAHPAPPRPSFRPMTIRTARDAVATSAGYLRWLGFRDVVQPEERSASGVDLRAPGLVAQVDPSTRPATLRAVECLWLNGLSNAAASVFFSLAGYTPEARSRADELGIPLFVLDLTGTPQPVNTPADELIATGA